MPNYQRLGSVPPKRHIQHQRPASESFLGEGIYYEHVVTTEGFARAYSTLYHRRPPTRVKSSEYVSTIKLKAAAEMPLQHHHLRTGDLPRSGDPITGRIALMFNDDVIASRCRPSQQQEILYSNAFG